MPITDISQYSRKQTLDVRSAMATAIARKLRDSVFPRGSGGSIKFAEVFESWPSYEQRYVPPSACVLPTPTLYDAARLTPTLLEDTWEPPGDVGFGLYQLADIEVEFEINIRAASSAERSDIIAGLEQAWVADGILMDQVAGARYGILLEMPEYWGLCAGFSLVSARTLDDEDKAMREHREAVLSVKGVASQVTLRPVRPLNLTVRVDMDCC